MATGSETAERPVTLWRQAIWLALFTIAYNLAEGLVSIYFGIQDEALTLFGFGSDSFIEVMSGIGILAMVLRIRHGREGERPRFERAALRVTGTAFYLLAAGLGFSAAYNLVSARKPDTSLPGLVIAIVSIAIMWVLVNAKRRVGRALHSPPILADANCTLACIYMSLVLLASSLLFQITSFGFADSLGAVGLIYFSLREGKESFEKSRGHECSCVEGTEP
jgi:hypothetical protein